MRVDCISCWSFSFCLWFHDSKHSHLRKVLFLSLCLRKYHLCTERTIMDEELTLVEHLTELEPTPKFHRLQELGVLYSKKRNLSTWVSFRQCHNQIKKFMRRGVKNLLEVQNKCVNLSSFVQDFYQIIYNSGQLSFATVSFPNCMLSVEQKLIFIHLSHDIWAYYMFKQLAWRACQGHGAIITSKSNIPFLKEGTNVCNKPFLEDFNRIKRVLKQMCKYWT